MLDIESFGIGRDAAIASIGAVAFEPSKGAIVEPGFHVRVNLAASRLPGVLNASTVEWWLSQPLEAQRRLVAEPRVPLGEALTQFMHWAKGADELWSNGPTFDEMIMRDAFVRHELEFPIHFRASRCCRTLGSIAKAKGYQFPKSERTDKHDALGDAIYQAKGVISIYEFLGLRKP